MECFAARSRRLFGGEPATSSLALADDDWGAFLVDRVDAKRDASLKLTCCLLGATSAEAWSALEALVQGEFLTIHLCLSRPCI